MLSKKQYVYTLMVAVIAFVAVFAITYFYTKANSWHVESNNGTQMESELVKSDTPDKVCVKPGTKIILKNEKAHHSLSETKVEAKSLLGLTEEEVAARFKDYVIETFSEEQVTLVKNVDATTKQKANQATYVLGVEDDYVCIKEKNTDKRPVKIDYEVTHFSKYMYSLLLDESIEITSQQKEALLLNPSTLQRILQSYVEE